MWVQQKAKEGETVKITWSDWYAKIIGVSESIGVLLFYCDRMVIDLGNRRVWLPSDTDVEVWDK